MEGWVIAIVSVLLAVVLFYVGFSVRAPRLKMVGSSSGSGKGQSQWGVRIGNPPGWIGLRLRQTVLFGKQLHGDFSFGVPVSRNPAEHCHGWLVDKESGKTIVMLWWRLPGGSYERDITLANLEKRELMVLASTGDGQYFPFHIDDPSDATPVPPDNITFNETREFIVLVNYVDGRRKLRVPMTVEKGFDKRLTVRYG